MMKITNRSTTRFGIPLLVLMGLSLVCSPAFAHKVHTHEHTSINPADEAQSLVTAFRIDGDDVHLDAAWHLLEGEIQDSSDVVLLTNAATVAQARHDFDLSLELINRALVIRPGFDQAWLLRASLFLVKGEVGLAGEACSQLRSSSQLVRTTCRARVSIAQGESGRALTVMKAVLAAARLEEADSGVFAWALSVAGDAAVSIDREQAGQYFERSLEMSDSTQVRAAFVDNLLQQGDIDRASAVLADGSDALPLLVRRLVVAVRTDKRASVEDLITATDRSFRAWMSDKDWVHAREMTRFYVDVMEQPELAKRLALINLNIQREPEDLLLAHRTEVCQPCD